MESNRIVPTVSTPTIKPVQGTPVGMHALVWGSLIASVLVATDCDPIADDSAVNIPQSNSR